MSFSQIIPPFPSPTESKRLFYTSVSLLLSHIQGYCYHLSKFHIYALVLRFKSLCLKFGIFLQMCGIHHHSLIQNSFTGLKHTLFFTYSTLLFCRIFYQPLIFFYTLYSLAFPIVLYNWNHTVCSLFTLASFSCFQSLRSHGLCSPWNSPGQNIGVSSLSLLQGIFPAQGSNPGIPHCRQILLPAEPQRSPFHFAESI